MRMLMHCTRRRPQISQTKEPLRMLQPLKLVQRKKDKQININRKTNKKK